MYRKIQFFIVLIVMITILFQMELGVYSVLANENKYVITESYRIAEGATYEQKEAEFENYWQISEATIRSLSWSAGYGTGNICITRKHPSNDTFITDEFSLTYSIPDILIPGEKAKVTYTLNGDISNFPAEWSPEGTWIGSLSIGLYTGNDGNNLGKYGQNLSIYNTMKDKTITGDYEFVVPTDVHFLVIHVMHGTSIIGGIGTGYTYELDGVKGKPIAISSNSLGSPIKDSEIIEYYPPGGYAGGFVSSMSGNVEYAENAEDAKAGKWNFLKPGVDLKGGWIIKTGGNSSCILSWDLEGSTVINEETFITIRPLPKKKTWLDIKKGTFIANVNSILHGKGTFIHDVETPEYQAIPTGTIFVCERQGEVSTLKVIEGVVVCASKITDQTETIRPGEMMTVDTDGLFEKKIFDATSELSFWDNLTLNITNDSSVLENADKNEGSTLFDRIKLLQFKTILIYFGGISAILLIVFSVIRILVFKKNRKS